MKTELERLIEIGRRRDGLTVDDLQRHLPLEALRPAQLADVLTTIENAGVAVEIDPALTRGRPRMPTERQPMPSISSEVVAPDHRKKIAALDTSIRNSKERAARAPHAPQQYGGGTVFLGMAVVVCIIMLLALWLMDKGL